MALGLVEHVEGVIARLKVDRAMIDEHLKTLQAELAIAKAALSGGAPSEPLTGRGIMIRKDSWSGPTASESTANGTRKPRAPRGSGKSIGARILAMLSAHGVVNMTVDQMAIALSDVSERAVSNRTVSFTLQSLKKQGRVIGHGNGYWSLSEATRDDIAANAIDAR